MPRRKPIRLAGYDYSTPGAYFVTICTHEKRCILSTIPVGAGALDGPSLQLTALGEIVEKHILSTEHIPGMHVDKYVIMPNHIHLILTLEQERGPSRAPAPTGVADGYGGSGIPANEKLPRAIGVMKRLTNKEAGKKLFQRSYYEHVIRNEADYRRIWEYIDTNPAKWTEDCYYTTEP